MHLAELAGSFMKRVPKDYRDVGFRDVGFRQTDFQQLQEDRLEVVRILMDAGATPPADNTKVCACLNLLLKQRVSFTV